MTQTSASAPAPGANIMPTPNSTEMTPPRIRSHSLSISLRSWIAPMICNTPVAIAHPAMKNSSTSALRPGIRNVRSPAAIPSTPTIASHQRATGNGGNDRKHAVHQRKGAIEQNQRQQRQARPGKGEHAENDRRDAPQQQQPPVLRQCMHHGRPEASSGLSISLYRSHGTLLSNDWKAPIQRNPQSPKCNPDYRRNDRAI